MAPVGTRRRVLDAALASFVDDGYEGTTVARIRERSQVSNGALFHHFPTKEAVADALYVEAMASAQEGLWELVRSRPRSLRAAVRGVIANQLGWVEEHADLARFVYMRGHLDWQTPASAELAALNRDLAAAFREWMAPLVERGDVRPAPMLMITAIVTGPAHSIAQRWLAGHVESPLTDWIDGLTDAACAALKGTPVRANRPRRPQPPHRGRVTLELVSEDGSVIAHGRATADLLPTEGRR
jgi:AcrR family transcriptional regulator